MPKRTTLSAICQITLVVIWVLAVLEKNSCFTLENNGIVIKKINCLTC
jgi:hypothetical protein